LNTPIEDVVVLVAFTKEKVMEEFANVRIVRFVIKAEHMSVFKEDAKFVGETTAEEISGGGHLLLHNVIILQLFGSSIECLPWEDTMKEVHE
jgi:hypothetical protein